MSIYFDLYDYRRRVTAIYEKRRQSLQAGEDVTSVWQRYRQSREKLFREHPQSALDEEQQRAFQGLPYFPYHADFCVPARIDTAIEPTHIRIVKDENDQMNAVTVAHLHFSIQHQPAMLALYWLDIYGGGLFLPFCDTTSPAESYGGGRYLFDTIKGSDFLSGTDPQATLLLDFNYAYNPSCAYNNRWVCPLAPSENHLSIAIKAGEQKFHADS
jgi:uncharacterized protein (DUF1684 family)